MYRFLLPVILFSFTLIAQSPDSPDITKEEIAGHIKFLASDQLEGRAPGTGKDLEAARYIRQSLEGKGVKFLFEDGFQYFEVSGGTVVSDKSTFSLNGTQLVFDKDFTPLAISANGEITSEVVFAGYGYVIDDKEVKINNFPADVKGKWVLILRGSPANSKHSDLFEKNSSLRKKIITAKDNGAAGVLFVNGVEFDKNDNLINASQGSGEPDAGLPAISITRIVADKILKPSGKTIEELEAALIKDINSVTAFTVATPVKANPVVTRNKKKTLNVAAMIEGSDPKLKDEYIVIGAHYDHLGWGGPGTGTRRPDTVAIHNGADDNASGTSTILEIFEKLAANRSSLKRSVILVAFGAEEMGLLGSRYFVDNSPVDLKKIRMMINLDMVGRLDAKTKVLSLGGTGTAVNFEKFFDHHVSKSGLEVKRSPEGYGPSDHASFYSKDIPVLFFFTGVHDDYHTPGDDFEKINVDGSVIIGDLAYNIVSEVASSENAPEFQLAGPKERPKDQPTYKISLGIMPDMSATDVKGVRAENVIPGRPADKAGMKKGDVIIEINSKPVKDLYEYMERLGELKKGDLIDVIVMRGEEKITLKVQL